MMGSFTRMLLLVWLAMFCLVHVAKTQEEPVVITGKNIVFTTIYKAAFTKGGVKSICQGAWITFALYVNGCFPLE